jgi:uncharacterized membrane protein YdjX (TVP38/TMEM64 family)
MNTGNFMKYLIYSVFAIVLVVSIFFLGVFMLCGILEGSDLCQWWPHISIEHIVAYIRSSGFWGILASIGIMVLHSFIPFPGELVAISNGMIYGPLWGTVITWTGAMIGAFLSFFLARRLGRPFVQKILNKKSVEGIDEWINRYGSSTLLISRFIPIIAFNLINYAAGLTCITWWSFAWTTGLGILPLTTIMVIMGVQIHTLPMQAWLILLIAGVIIWLLSNYILRKTHKHTSDKECAVQKK